VCFVTTSCVLWLPVQSAVHVGICEVWVCGGTEIWFHCVVALFYYRGLCWTWAPKYMGGPILFSSSPNFPAIIIIIIIIVDKS
jgi:hypothetical protein